MLAIGTHDGLYHVEDAPFEEAELALNCGTVHVIDAFEDVGLLAATDGGLYHSRDGYQWHTLDTPHNPVVSVVVSSDREHCYVGTYPAHIYRLEVPDWSEPTQNDWTECETFHQLPSQERWADRSPRENGSQVRTLAVHRNAPDRVVAGIEVGGVCVSDDRGETWTERSYGVHDDVHDILMLTPDEYITSCGNGLYRTRDAGRTWVRQDTDFRDFWFNYYRETIPYDGLLYTSAYGWGPAEGHGAIFAIRNDGVMEPIPFPGSESSFVLSWATDGHRLFGGTMGVAERFQQHSPADVLVYEDDNWSVVGTVPAGVKSLTVH